VIASRSAALRSSSQLRRALIASTVTPLSESGVDLPSFKRKVKRQVVAVRLCSTEDDQPHAAAATT
jgi:hypothetical protein